MEGHLQNQGYPKPFPKPLLVGESLHLHFILQVILGPGTEPQDLI